MTLKEKFEEAEQQLKQAVEQAQIWSTRVAELRGRAATLAELVKESETPAE